MFDAAQISQGSLEINGRRQKSIDGVCFKLYYAGLSGLFKIEAEERWLFVTPREHAEVRGLKYCSILPVTESFLPSLSFADFFWKLIPLYEEL